MATYENTISILIKATDAASSVLKATGDQIDGTATRLNNLGKTATDVGRSLTTGLTLPIAALVGESAKMAMNFQQTMELLHTNAGIAQKDIAGMSQAILTMASQVGASPEALATAMYHIASAGQGIFSTSQMLQQLRVAAEGAAVGQANLDDTTYALTSTLAANVKGATDYNQTMGTLLAIVGSGDMKLQDLNDVISTGLMGTLSTFGVSLQSAGAALADFGDLGERGAIAGTRLRMMLALMASPSKEAAKILGDLGLTTDEVNTSTGTMNEIFAKTGLTTTRLANDLRQPNGIYVAITDLKTQLEKAGLTASQTDAILSKAFGGGRTDAALLQLLNTTGRLNAKFDDINATSGNFARNWAVQQQQAKQQWNAAWDGIQADMIRLGVAILPEVVSAMKAVGRGVSDVTNWFSGLSHGQKQLVIDIAAVMAALGPLLLIFGSMARAVSSLIVLNGLLGKAMFGAAAEGEASMGALGGTIAAVRGGMVSFVSFVGGAASLAVWGALAGAAVGAFVLIENKANETKRVIDQMQAGINADMNSSMSALQNLESMAKSGNKVAAGLLANPKFQQDLQPVRSNTGNVFSDLWTGIRGFAGGTEYAPGGLAIVGENGPELVNLPRGSQVTPSDQTQAILNNATRNIQAVPGGAAGSTTINLTVKVGSYLGSPADKLNIARDIWQALQNIARQHGAAGALPNIGVLPL